jgi:hypothetical protein
MLAEARRMVEACPDEGKLVARGQVRLQNIAPDRPSAD